MVTAQQWLDEKYPNKNKNNQATEIDLTDLKTDEITKLVQLEIKDFPKLKTIKKSSINNYKINNLTIANCPQLTHLEISPGELTILNINPDSAFTDLNFLKSFVNLTRLSLSNNSNLSGSLQPLQKMTDLKTLDIGGTNINSGLEYLPINLKNFHCGDGTKPASKANELAKKLKDYGIDGNYNLEVWKEKNDLEKKIKQLLTINDENDLPSDWRDRLVKKLESEEVKSFLNDYLTIIKDSIAIYQEAMNSERDEAKKKEYEIIEKAYQAEIDSLQSHLGVHIQKRSFSYKRPQLYHPQKFVCPAISMINCWCHLFSRPHSTTVHLTPIITNIWWPNISINVPSVAVNPSKTHEVPLLKDNTLIYLAVKDVTKYRWGTGADDHLGSYRIEMEEDIPFEGGRTGRVMGFYKYTDSSKINTYLPNREADTFYFFIYYLGKRVHIPIHINNSYNGIWFFSLSDGGVKNVYPTPAEVIREEKKKWDNLGYTAPADLVQDNKKWVDLGIRKERVNTYRNIEKIVKDFAKERLEGKNINVHFGEEAKKKYIEIRKNDSEYNALAFADPQTSDLYLLEPEDHDLIHGGKEEWNPIKSCCIIAHELSHDVVHLSQSKLPNDPRYLHPIQVHSKTFWEIFLDGKWGESSVLNFVRSKLGTEDQRKFDEFVRVSNEQVKNEDVRWTHFPDANEVEGKIRRKKYFNAQEIDNLWRTIRQDVFRWVESSMNVSLNNWGRLITTDDWRNEARWVQMYIRNKTEEDQGRFKIYIFHNNGNEIFEWTDKGGHKQHVEPAAPGSAIPDDLRQNLEQNYGHNQGWEIEGIPAKKARSSSFQIPQHTCGYSTQIEVPPKGNN